MLNKVQKKYRDRANRARRKLLKEKEMFGGISDGSGKRYRVCVDYVRSDAPKKAAAFMDWFHQEFPDDIGEPAFFLYAAIAYYRIGMMKKARGYLLDAMLSNIYMLPYLSGQPLPRQDMWHPSYWEQPDYLLEIKGLLREPTDQEREWFKTHFADETFSEIRTKYIETYRALQHERELEARGRILDEWREYASSVRENLGDPG